MIPNKFNIPVFDEFTLFSGRTHFNKIDKFHVSYKKRLVIRRRIKYLNFGIYLDKWMK